MENDKPTTYSVEYVTEIWNDKTGARIEFGPDRDGLDLVEIRSRLSDGEVETSLTMQPEEACLLGQELVKRYGPKANVSSPLARELIEECAKICDAELPSETDLRRVARLLRELLVI